MGTDSGETYTIEQVTYGRFLGDDPQMLVLVRRPPEELAHAQGFYNAYLAVFDAREDDHPHPGAAPDRR